MQNQERECVFPTVISSLIFQVGHLIRLASGDDDGLAFRGQRCIRRAFIHHKLQQSLELVLGQGLGT